MLFEWVVIALTNAAPASPRELPRFDLPLEVSAISAADEFATYSCSFWAKRCWSSFAPPPQTLSDGAPSLACGITTAGGVVCWAMAETSLFGEALAVTHVPTLGHPTQLAVGRSELCALDTSGALSCQFYAWDTSTRTWVFAETKSEAGSYRAVDAGSDRICAVSTAGDVRCWWSSGDCDNLDEDVKPRPVRLSCTRQRQPQVLPDSARAVDLSTSWLGGCAQRSDGTLACWDENRLDGKRPEAWQQIGQLGNVTAVAAANTHACAARRDGSLFCWAATRGPAFGTARAGEVVRVPTPTPVQKVWARDQLTCWLDDRQDAYCQTAGGPPEVFASGVTELALGKQLCARFATGAVSCWAAPLKTSIREGDTLVTTSATVFTGAGASALGRAAGLASDFGLRAELSFGAADRDAELVRSVGPILEFRMRDLHTREVAAGGAAYWAPARAGNPALSLSVMGGYADRARHDEPLVVGLVRVNLRQSTEARAQARERAHYALQIGLYAESRYGLRTRTLDLSGGLELDLWLLYGAWRAVNES